MTTVELLTHLRRLNVELWIEDDRLRYRAPAGVLTTELRTTLSARKAEVSAFLKLVQRASRKAGPIPLSFAQQRLWFLDQLQPASPTYNIPMAIRLQGTLDVAALAASLSAIVARHEILRTTFAVVDGAPVQVIAPIQPHPLPIVDQQTVQEDQRAAAMQQLVAAEAQQPFDLQRGPLFRTTLARFDPDDHGLLITVHHIVFDGWSYALLTQELSALYTAYSAGQQDAGLPNLPLQYADYALWQREWLAGCPGRVPMPGGHPHGTRLAPGAVLEQQLSYWRQQLGGMPAILQLPTDRPRPPVQSAHGATYEFELSGELTAALQELSRRENATLFMTLLAAFQVVLHRYSGQDDIAVGTPIAGRTRPELEQLIGFFINTLVLRADLAGNPSFRDLLRQVREVALQAYTHQDVPFEMLVEALQPERDLSHHPLFQVMFALQNMPSSALELPSLHLELIEVESSSVKFDLGLTMTMTTAGLRGYLQYNTDLFAATTIERLVGHLHTLLNGIALDPEQRIDDLPMLTEAEYQQLAAWNAVVADTPTDRCLHHLFEAQAARTPEQVALVCGERQLTYAALNVRANQLAHHLQALGVKPEMRVGLCLERSLDLVVGLLGILKAGGAYVPLDPAYPAERLEWMLADAQISILVTQQTLRATLPAHAAQQVCLDSDWQQIAQQSSVDPGSAVHPDHLAYVIYTSGSTGRPKGVEVAHRSVVNVQSTVQQRFGFCVGDAMPWIASVAFDIALLELCNPLLGGGTSIVLTREEILDLPRLHEVLTGCTALHAVPSLLRQIVQHATTTHPHMRLVFVGGEAVSPDLLAALPAVFPNAEAHVLYGPTEATIICASYHVPRDTPIVGHPIGTPLPNQQLRIADDQGRPVPIGVIGELYIGGAGVARGYLNRPELTAEKFIVLDGQRWYRSGDRARFQADGTIEFLGRLDHQIKLRGFRIELEEIEAVLRRHPGVREAVVVAREDRPLAGGHPDQRLVAYVVGKEQGKKETKEHHSQAAKNQDNHQQDESQGENHERAEVDAPSSGAACSALVSSELQSFIQEQLPAYMVPSAFVVLQTLPLTPQGKLDRRRLPAPDTTQLDRETFVAPRDRWEWQLAQIWQAVLGLEQVSVTANFFERGGHSLLAVRLMAQIQQHFDHTLPLTTLFQAPTIELLAARLRHDMPAQPWSPLVALQPHGTQRPFFCVHPVGGTVLCYTELTRHLSPNRPCYGLQALGIEPGQTPLTSVEEMAAEYITAMRAVQPDGPYLLGGWSLGGVIAFEMAQQLQRAGQLVERLVLLDSSPPYPEVVPADDLLLVVNFARDLGGLFGKELPITPNDLRLRAADDPLEYVLVQAREHGVVPPDVEPEQLRRLAGVFQANQQAALRYTPQPLPQGIILLRASESFGPGELPDLSERWRSLALNVAAHPVPGNHYTMLRSPQVQSVASQLEACLPQATA